MAGGGGGDRSGGASRKLKRAARRLFLQTCGAMCSGGPETLVLENSIAVAANVFRESNGCSSSTENRKPVKKMSSPEIMEHGGVSSSSPSDKNLCAICLDPLNYSSMSNAEDAIFTAQCSHAFHFGCISSNVRHGNVTCPICRAHWTQLPRNLKPPCLLHGKTDPILQILDDSIANLRVHRRSFLRTARYDDDDPIELDSAGDRSRLHMSLLNIPQHQASDSGFGSGSGSDSYHHCHHFSTSSPLEESSPPFLPTSLSNRAYLHLKLSHQPSIDVVLVASPNGPHLRLMKQAMSLVVFSLRPTDRLAIVTYSSSAARIFPLRCMTSYGKRTALQVIDRLFYMGQADPTEGLRKGVKILIDRVHKNPHSSILHLTDSPSRSYHWFDTEVPIPIHRFHVGVGFASSDGIFEEFLARTLGGGVNDVQLRIGEGGMIINIGELRGGEERNIPLYVGDENESVTVEYSYREGGNMRRGESVISMKDGSENREEVHVRRRMSNGENWGYYDPFMARRWAKHLHGYRV